MQAWRAGESSSSSSGDSITTNQEQFFSHLIFCFLSLHWQIVLIHFIGDDVYVRVCVRARYECNSGCSGHCLAMCNCKYMVELFILFFICVLRFIVYCDLAFIETISFCIKYFDELFTFKIQDFFFHSWAVSKSLFVRVIHLRCKLHISLILLMFVLLRLRPVGSNTSMCSLRFSMFVPYSLPPCETLLRESSYL